MDNLILKQKKGKINIWLIIVAVALVIFGIYYVVSSINQDSASGSRSNIEQEDLRQEDSKDSSYEIPSEPYVYYKSELEDDIKAIEAALLS